VAAAGRGFPARLSFFFSFGRGVCPCMTLMQRGCGRVLGGPSGGEPPWGQPTPQRGHPHRRTPDRYAGRAAAGAWPSGVLAGPSAAED